MTPLELAWQEFVKQAQEIYPPFVDENLIKAVLKSRGETTFKPEYAYKFICILKSIVDGWQSFLLDAIEIDNELGNDRLVARILLARGITWYLDFDITNGLNVLKDWHIEKIKVMKPWDYRCPVCGSFTKRDRNFDNMYRKECNGLGWKCLVGGKAHFHQAAWAPMREKFVFYSPKFE
jgi:hypothetical protein